MSKRSLLVVLAAALLPVGFGLATASSASAQVAPVATAANFAVAPYVD
jgi:hypothetical protein